MPCVQSPFVEHVKPSVLLVAARRRMAEGNLLQIHVVFGGHGCLDTGM